MQEKQTYEIDGRNFSTLDGFYEEISRVLVPGHDWGCNLDAFNDILRGGFGTPPGGFVIRWKHSGLSQERLGHRETERQLKARLLRCHHANWKHVGEQIKLAQQVRGPTMFDELVEIIRLHCPGGEEEADGVELILE